MRDETGLAAESVSSQTRARSGPVLASFTSCLAFGSLVLSGCTSTDESVPEAAQSAPDPARIEPGGEAGGFRGMELINPIPLPAFTLTDTSGEPFDYLAETAGSLSFLFFGFTHCPDICPVQLANLAAALGDLPYSDRRQIEVVFVSTDPERDTPEVVRDYLDRFDAEFVGLVAPIDTVNGLLVSMDLPPAIKEPVPGTDDYTVGHVAQIMAITGDGLIRLAYPGGIRQNDWRNDLPALLRLNAAVAGDTGR
ncbi:MAG: SCO family protein [Gemmatimonadota bacterium]|nr:SCO family protein [Gemmatimonadota bacterium]